MLSGYVTEFLISLLRLWNMWVTTDEETGILEEIEDSEGTIRIPWNTELPHCPINSNSLLTVLKQNLERPFVESQKQFETRIIEAGIPHDTHNRKSSHDHHPTGYSRLIPSAGNVDEFIKLRNHHAKISSYSEPDIQRKECSGLSLLEQQKYDLMVKSTFNFIIWPGTAVYFAKMSSLAAWLYVS
ncbi:hypothetical protein DAPPUDRAFT_318224 [Daphnia pulex]|uniref:Uncharacterized protein n=1 Tax=Daphnia pulex TaxID=6669 RepID=E9GI67_DAPPU|nr:hypothetical protein DAPPUDRAFT_318224 [Daphnia pulex]|eukprot:EFX80825.1 hypothetical protein DAPPUDRAFT_318224 [Daphnia pulex]